mmetsp:Transcript_38926/g.111838  ORF Transcript_38926/g.111838 Transcript_38926/m.111838 type:complete len:262 (-) Transcript_38926:499-1284(-)
MDLHDFRAMPELRPLAVAPTLVAVVVIPMSSLHLEPRPLEVVGIKGGPHSLGEALLQRLQFPGFGLCSLPLTTAGDHQHVSEDHVGDNHHLDVLRMRAELCQVFQRTESLDLRIILWLVPCPPLVSSLGLLRRADLHSIEPKTLDLLKSVLHLRKWPMEGMEYGPWATSMTLQGAISLDIVSPRNPTIRDSNVLELEFLCGLDQHVLFNGHTGSRFRGLMRFKLVKAMHAILIRLDCEASVWSLLLPPSIIRAGEQDILEF